MWLPLCRRCAPTILESSETVAFVSEFRRKEKAKYRFSSVASVPLLSVEIILSDGSDSVPPRWGHHLPSVTRASIQRPIAGRVVKD